MVYWNQLSNNRKTMTDIKDTQAWDEAVEDYCEETGIDINDIFIPEHEDAIKQKMDENAKSFK